MTPEAKEVVDEYRKIFNERRRLGNLFMNVDEYFHIKKLDYTKLEVALNEIDETNIVDCVNPSCATCQFEIFFKFMEENGKMYWYRDCMSKDGYKTLSDEIYTTKQRTIIMPISCIYYKYRGIKQHTNQEDKR